MKQLITSFDPTAVVSSQFNVGLPQNEKINGSYGYLLIANESSVSLIITINQDRFRIHPWQLDKVVLKQPTQFVAWAQEFILTNNASSPVSLVLVDGYTSDEDLPNTFPIPLVRNTNVGGTVTTAMTATLINDGSAAGTVIMESTPLGQATSAFSFDNSGNVVLRTLNSSVWSIIFQIISGGAGAATALFHGTADIASSVAAANVAAGTLASGVLLSKISSDAGHITSDGTLGNLIVNTVFTTGTKSNGTGSYGINATGPISTDNKNFATDGSGNLVSVGNIVGAGNISATQATFAGNKSFSKRGDFSGTGSGTVATGAGGTPTWVGITDNQGSSSMTVGVVISAANAIVTAGAGHTWMGVAI